MILWAMLVMSCEVACQSVWIVLLQFFLGKSVNYLVDLAIFRVYSVLSYSVAKDYQIVGMYFRVDEPGI